MKKTTCLALALAIGSSTAAHATGSASIQFTNLNIAIFDLNPNDNIVAGYEVLANAATTVVTGGSDTGEVKNAPGLFTPLTSSATYANGTTALASVGPAGFEATVNGTGAWANLSTNENYLPNIRLAPGTGILISGNYQVDLATDCPAPDFECGAQVELHAQFLGLSGWNNSFDDVAPNGEFGSGTALHKFFPVQAGAQTYTGSGGASYWNFSGYSRDLSLRITAEALVRSGSPISASIAAVPEPATVALLTAGLVTASLVRRKKALSS